MVAGEASYRSWSLVRSLSPKMTCCNIIEDGSIIHPILVAPGQDCMRLISICASSYGHVCCLFGFCCSLDGITTTAIRISQIHHCPHSLNMPLSSKNAAGSGIQAHPDCTAQQSSQDSYHRPRDQTESLGAASTKRRARSRQKLSKAKDQGIVTRLTWVPSGQSSSLLSRPRLWRPTHRPQCSSCAHIGVDCVNKAAEAETHGQPLGRMLGELELRIRWHEELCDILRNGFEKDAATVLNKIRDGADVESVVRQ